MSKANHIRIILAAVLLSAAAASAAEGDQDRKSTIWDPILSLFTSDEDEEDAPPPPQDQYHSPAPSNDTDDPNALIDTLILPDIIDANDTDQQSPTDQQPDQPPDPQAVPQPRYPADPWARPAPPPPTSPAAPRTPAASDWTTDLLGTAAFGSSHGELYTAHLSFEKLIWDKWTLALQPFGGVGVGREDTAGVFGFDHLLKYPLWLFQNGRVNFEGGGGIQLSGPKSWPDENDHLTFRVLLGTGIEFDTAQFQRLLFGVRWLHVGFDGSDPRVDNVMLYGGYRIRF